MSSESKVQENEKSALQDNIDCKGKNSYYFAHAHKATGPKWDGREQPRLLAKHSSSGINNNDDDDAADDDAHVASIGKDTENMQLSSLSNHAESLIKSLKEKKSGFDFAKSNITKYAFLDEGKKVKIYIDMKGVGDICESGDVQLDWNERTFSLKVYNYTSPDDGAEKEDGKGIQCLSFGKLHGFISKAAVRVKKDRLILTLTKRVEEGKEPDEWSSIVQKGEDDDQIV